LPSQLTDCKILPDYLSSHWKILECCTEMYKFFDEAVNKDCMKEGLL